MKSRFLAEFTLRSEATNGLGMTTVGFMLAASLSAVAAAQVKPTFGALATGDTLRVWAVSPRLDGAMGILDGIRRDTLTLRDMDLIVQPPRLIAQVPWMALRRVDVRRGTHRSGSRIVVGALIGAAAGTLLGAAVGPKIECKGSCNDDPDLAGIAGFILGAGGGFVVGGVTGGIIGGARRVPKWEAVRLSRE